MKTFAYSTVAFVPNPIRDDRLNIAVLVTDPETGTTAMRQLKSYRSRIRCLAPQVDTSVIGRMLERLMQAATGVQAALPLPGSLELSAERLASLRASFRNQLQFSDVRYTRALSLADATDDVARVHLAGSARPVSRTQPYSRERIRKAIKRAFSGRPPGPYRLDTQARRKVGGVTHQADFWWVNGTTEAALYAMPEDDEAINAIALRDSLPTVLAAFREANPGFRVVAVIPPTQSGFTQETSLFLSARDVDVRAVDELESLPDELIQSYSRLA